MQSPLASAFRSETESPAGWPLSPPSVGRLTRSGSGRQTQRYRRTTAFTIPCTWQNFTRIGSNSGFAGCKRMWSSSL